MSETTALITDLRELAGLRGFGVFDIRRQNDIRHGYLLALEELEQRLDQERARKSTSSPRDAA